MVALSLVFSAFLLTSHAHAQIAGNGSGTDLKVRIPVSAGWFAFTDRGWEAPAADCYLVSCTVRLSWSADECADTYTLLRADDDGTEMLRIITATMPCGQFIYRDRAVEDEDWYYIRLKPLCKAYVEFSQLDIDSSVAETCFLFAEQGGLPREVGNRTKIVIENTELHDRRVCFRIYPDMGKLFGGVPGSAVPAYRMELSEEVYK